MDVTASSRLPLIGRAAATRFMTTPERRATAFGILNAVFGFVWFLGSVLLGVIYDQSVTAVAGVSLILQLLSVPLLLVVMRNGALSMNSGSGDDRGNREAWP